jgi:hypothetical protein
MAISEPRQTNFDWRGTLCFASIVLGLLLVMLSVFLPDKALTATSWSPEQAKQYQAAALKMHTLSHTAIHSTPDKQQQVRRQLQDAEKEYAIHRAELDAALARPHRTTTTLRVAGIALTAAGGIGAYMRRNDAQPA